MSLPTDVRSRGWSQTRQQTATASPGPISVSSYNEYPARRPDPPPPMEPSTQRFGSLPRINGQTPHFKPDQQQTRQLPGLAELLSPTGRPDVPTAGGFNTTAPPSHFPSRPSISGNDPNSHYTNGTAKPVYWQTPHSHSPSFPTVPFSSRPAEHLHPSSYDESQARSMPPPTSAMSQMVSHPHQPQFLRPPTGSEMRPRPSITAVDIASQDARRDSARSNSFAAPTNAECVGQREIPGKGLCFVYKDGGTCPTVIDGEVVNPMWGTTKAGKARKRLAQACLACREKKIRCEPRLPKCLQCEKSKRECIMYVGRPQTTRKKSSSPSPRPSAQQSQSECASNASSGSPLPALSPAPVNQQPVLEGSSRSWTHNGSPAPKRRRSHETSPNHSSGNSHRNQMTSESPLRRVLVIRSTPAIRNCSAKSPQDRASGLPAFHDSPFPGAGDKDWTIDPYLSNGEATLRLVDVFFAEEYCCFLFPPSTFRRWVIQCRDKSREELMVLYSLLAISSALIAENTSFSKTCTERAVNAVADNFGLFSLALIQSRLFLSTFFLAKGQESLFWEYSGAMLRALSAARLNVEDGCRSKREGCGRNMFDLTDAQLTECKRRTFWAAFMTDRLAVVFAQPHFQITVQSIRLKLPCRDEDYESGQLSRAPLFQASDSAAVHPATASPTLAAMIAICQLMAEVWDLASTSMFTSETTYAQEYEAQFSRLHARLQHWYNERPAEIRMLGLDIRGCGEHMPAGKAVTCLALYHGTILHLTRAVRCNLLPREQGRQHRIMAQDQATHVLSLARMLCTMAQNLPQGQGLHNLVSPMMGWAVFNAIDTITSSGLLRNIDSTLALAMEGHKLLEAVSHVWYSSKIQSEKAGDRIMALQAKSEESRERIGSKSMPETVPQAWRMAVSMSDSFNKGCDIMFEDDDDWLLEVLQSNK